jgi:hypothetical protein
LENDRSCIDQSYRPVEKRASSRKLATVTCGFISLQFADDPLATRSSV